MILILLMIAKGEMNEAAVCQCRMVLEGHIDEGQGARPGTNNLSATI
jgi:hypothetical protein